MDALTVCAGLLALGLAMWLIHALLNAEDIGC